MGMLTAFLPVFRTGQQRGSRRLAAKRSKNGRGARGPKTRFLTHALAWARGAHHWVRLARLGGLGPLGKLRTGGGRVEAAGSVQRSRFAPYGWSTKNSNSRNANRHGARLDEWSGELTAQALAACAVDGDRCQVYPQRVPRRCSTTNYIAASILAKFQHKTLTLGACTKTIGGCD